jgi:hypothetical protein
MDTQRCCLFDRVSAKFSKIKLKQVYATKNTSMHSRASERLNLRRFGLIWTMANCIKTLSAYMAVPPHKQFQRCSGEFDFCSTNF